MKQVERSEAALAGFWPEHGSGPVAVCAQVASRAERAVLTDWIRDNQPEDVTARTVTVPYPKGDDVAPVERAMRHALADEKSVILPLRVVWKPRDQSRLPHQIESLIVGDPRHPRPRAQPVMRRLQGDRPTVVVGEPATVGEMRAAWTMRRDAERDEFSRFVARRLVLALERAESLQLGPQHKVPRLVREEIITSSRFRTGLRNLAQRLGRSESEIGPEAEKHLDGLVAGYSRPQTDLTMFISRHMYAQGYEREIDYVPAQVERVREAMRAHPTVTLSSHRSHLDGMVLPVLSQEFGLPRAHMLAGDNMDFWPVGAIMRRAGGIFVRRDSSDVPVYRYALREYIGYLVEKRFHLEWFIEGGRSRTGKLLPPRLGALVYVVDAYRQGRTDDVALIPVSITYDQLRDAGDFAGEATGKAKQAEDAGWLVRLWRGNHDRYGKVYVRFGEPVSLREMIGPPGTGPEEGVEDVGLKKVAFEVAWRINQVTPATGTALVTLTLLASVGRALTLHQLRAALTALIGYAISHDLPMTDSARSLDTDEGAQAALDALIHFGVVTRFDDGPKPVFGIGEGQHLVAAFYRNSIIHSFLNDAIIELALAQASEDGTDSASKTFWDAAMSVRDLLKFDFFFQEKERFAADLAAELTRRWPNWESRLDEGPTGAQEVLDHIHLPVAHAILRPFLEAYLVVATGLAADTTPAADFDQKAFVKSCTGRGRQMLLQKLIERPESVSTQLFTPAVKLAENRGLLAEGTDVADKRAAFVIEIRAVLARIDAIEQAAKRHYAQLMVDADADAEVPSS